MPFDWKEYLLLAQYLQSQGNGTFSREAAHRCAVSRAYYAAFCHARNYARDYQGFVSRRDANEHERVRSHFQHRGNMVVANDLAQLRQWRNLCDYYDNSSNFALMLVGAIVGAQRIFESLR
jgi:hypothetical protein